MATPLDIVLCLQEHKGKTSTEFKEITVDKHNIVDISSKEKKKPNNSMICEWWFQLKMTQSQSFEEAPSHQ